MARRLLAGGGWRIVTGALRERRINNRDRRRDGKGATSRSQISAEMEHSVPISAGPDVPKGNRDFCWAPRSAPKHLNKSRVEQRHMVFGKQSTCASVKSTCQKVRNVERCVEHDLRGYLYLFANSE